MTVPNPRHGPARLNADGSFAYEYKYGRTDGLTQPETRVVPLGPDRLDAGTRQRLAGRVPCAWRLLLSSAPPRAGSQ